MVQDNKIDEPSTTFVKLVNKTTMASSESQSFNDNHEPVYPTDTIAAVTIAVLAVVIIMTLVLVFRALRKRQRARQGQQFGDSIQMVSTGIMGTGAMAHANSLNSVPVNGVVRWVSIGPSEQPHSSSMDPPR